MMVLELSSPMMRWAEREPIVLWGLRLSDGTPAGRRVLMWAYLGAAALAGVAGHGLPEPLRPLAVLQLMMCISWAIEMWRMAAVPLYVAGGPPITSEAWAIEPGGGIGPFGLGPADVDAIHLLRRAHAVWRRCREVTYLLRHAEGWTAVTGTTRALADAALAPDPADLVTITAVETICPLHATAGDVRAGQQLPNAVSVLGPPGDVDYRPGLALLHYRGLVIGAHRMRVRSLRVVPATP